MMLAVQWSQSQLMALLVGSMLYALLVIACHRIASAERRWREERRQLAAENLKAIVDVEAKIRVEQKRLEGAKHPGCAMDAQIKILELEQALRALQRKEAQYGYAAPEEE